MSAKQNQEEMKVFEYYARYGWPIHRMFIKNVLSRRCTRCTLSEKATTLVDGICELCRHPKPEDPNLPSKADRERMSREVDEILKSHEGKGRGQFDALQLFSGGKDSVYLLHILRTRFPKLRILALMIDNTFLPEFAFTNAQRVFDQLSVASLTFRPDRAFYDKIFRHAFLNLGTRESADVVDQFDGDIIHDVSRNVAARFKIPLIISGVQIVQVLRYVGIKHYETPRTIEEGRRTELAGFQLASFLNKDELAYFWDGTQWPKEDLPRTIFPFYAWEYHEDKVIEEVTSLGLIPKKSTNPLATNHHLLPLMGAVDIIRLGYSSYEPEFADLIRSGKAERAFWQSVFEMQEYAIKTKQFLNQSIDTALKRLSLTRSDLNLN